MNLPELIVTPLTNLVHVEHCVILRIYYAIPLEILLVLPLTNHQKPTLNSKKNKTNILVFVSVMK